MEALAFVPSEFGDHTAVVIRATGGWPAEPSAALVALAAASAHRGDNRALCTAGERALGLVDGGG